MKHLLLLCIVLSSVACQTTFTGFLTGTEYNLCVGLTDDMPAYTKQRNEIIGVNKANTKIEDEQDCLVNPDESSSDNLENNKPLP